MQLPAPGARHVLAAAIRASAKFIITFNLRDFPSEAITPYQIQAKHPDNFILDLLSLNATAVCQAAERQRSRLRKPPKTPDEYLETLVNQGLVQSVARMRELCYGS